MKTKNYWTKRFELLENASNNYSHDVYKSVEKSFIEAQKKIQAEIDVWYTRLAQNNNISLHEARKLLTAKELKEFKWDVNEYIKYGKENALGTDWMKELENASAKFHISRLEELKIRTQHELEKAFGNELDEIDEMARRIYTNDYYHSAYEIQKGFNVGFNIGEIDENKLDKLIKKPWASDGKNFSDRVWTSKRTMITDLHNELVRTCILGKSPDMAIKNMTKYVDKKFKNAKIQAGRLIMTEQAFFSSVAQKDCFNDLDVEKYEIVATLDSHTSEICQNLDGKVYDMKDFQAGVTAPPFHVWCRSTTVPWFDDDFGEGMRSARGEDGKTYYVPDNMTYKEWKASFVDGKVDINLKEAPKSGIIKTVDDAKKALVNDIGFAEVEKSFDKIDDDLIIANTKQLKKLEDKFGMIHESNGTICSEPNRTANAYVRAHVTNPSHQNLSLCPSHFKDKAHLINSEKESIEKGWFMPCKLIDDELMVKSLTHEYGHILQNVLVKREMESLGWTSSNSRAFIDYSKKTKKAMFKWYEDVENKVLKRCYNEIIEIAKNKNANFSLSKNISGYGKTNYAEFFAEVFSNSQLSTPNELGDAMNEWLKRKGLVK